MPAGWRSWVGPQPSSSAQPCSATDLLAQCQGRDRLPGGPDAHRELRTWCSGKRGLCTWKTWMRVLAPTLWASCFVSGLTLPFVKWVIRFLGYWNTSATNVVPSNDLS